MVRSQKSIGGVVGVAVGNAPYKIGDRTKVWNPSRALSTGGIQHDKVIRFLERDSRGSITAHLFTPYSTRVSCRTRLE